MEINLLILQCLAGMPEEALRVIALMQTPQQSGAFVPGQTLSSLSAYQEFIPKCYDSIPSTQTRDFYAKVRVDNVKNPQAVNVLGLMNFFGFGSLGYNVAGGQPDYFHPRRRVRWNYGTNELPYFGDVPDTGQYSLNQRAIYWMLNNLPLETGKIEIIFQHGEAFAFLMESDDYLYIMKQE